MPLVPLLHDVVPQMVEQLVDFLTPLDFPVPGQVTEVPKIVSLVEAIDQPVDIPVRAGSGTGGRLQGFLPGQFLLVCGAER